MKNLIFILSILLFTQVIYSQNFLADSLHVLSHETGDWEVVEVHVFDYVDPQTTDAYVYEIDSLGQRNFLYLSTISYNANGDEIERELRSLNMSTNEYELYFWGERFYDEDFNLLGNYNYDVDPISMDTTKSFGFEYGAYDSFGNYQEFIFYEGTDNNSWEVLVEEFRIHSYNPNDLLDSTAIFRVGNFSGANAYNYNDSNELMEQRQYFSPDDRIDFRYRFNYEDSKLIESTRERFDFQVDSLAPNVRLTFTYDDNEDLICRVTELYDEEYFFTTKRQYFFSGLSSTQTLLDDDLDVTWMNRGGGHLEISVDGLNATEKYRIGIFNMLGQQVKSLSLSNQEMWNNSYLLDSGSYVLVIKDQMNRVHTEKMVVVR